jgi:uncharacterized protein DUF6228
MTDPHVDDHSGIRLGTSGDAATLTFGEAVLAINGSAGVAVSLALRARNLSADATAELELWGGGTAELVAYFEDMAASWRGWAGAKEWTDDGRTVALSATHDGIGAIEIAVSVSSHAGWPGPGSWAVQMVVAEEPGAIEGVATRLRTLLRR